MTFDRRSILTAGVGLGAAATAAKAGEIKPQRETPGQSIPGLEPNSERDSTAVLQAAIDAAAAKNVPLILPPGTIRVSDLRLRAGTRLIGQARSTVIQFSGGAAFVSGEKADGLVLRDIVFDGAFMAHDARRSEALVNIANSKDIIIDGVEIRNGAAGGLALSTSSGRVENCTIRDVLDFGMKSLDAAGLDIRCNTVSGCGNNGILVWRSEQGEDGSTIINNRIANIRNAAGGTGEYGNGINVFRAGSIIVSGNRISDCAYTAIRGNAASNIQILGNSCERLGEVAIYSEFGFEGALIANNLIDIAATGISVTNFNEGGRLAVIQGNLIRNLFRREHEKEDKRGEGIGIEADAAVTGNTIEGAPTVGIQIGWGPFMRDVAATGNVIRNAKVGISITSAPEAGACLIANNLISKTEDGAIRKMTLGVTTGPDLAREPPPAGRMTITGNVAV
jgi:uncharacterized secreted repeat protein (TIGR03808 family)